MQRHLLLAAFIIGAAALMSGCQSDSSYASSSPEISSCNRLQVIQVPAERFNKTARALTQSSSCFIKTDLADPSSIQLAAVSGRLSIAAALSQALAPTHLHMTQHGDTLIVD